MENIEGLEDVSGFSLKNAFKDATNLVKSPINHAFGKQTTYNTGIGKIVGGLTNKLNEVKMKVGDAATGGAVSSVVSQIKPKDKPLNNVEGLSDPNAPLVNTEAPLPSVEPTLFARRTGVDIINDLEKRDQKEKWYKSPMGILGVVASVVSIVSFIWWIAKKK